MDPAPRIVLTRQRESNRDWTERLTAAGHAVLELPLLEFEPLPAPEGFSLAGYDWILFTSPQGVRAFAAAGLAPRSARVGVLSPGTRAALEAAGWTDDLRVDCLDGAELAAAFTAKFAGPGRVLLPGPERRMADPRATLEHAGFEVTELPLYRTGPVDPASLPDEPFAGGDVVLFCSPSTVRAFAARWNARPAAVAIGETTAAAAREFDFPVAVAATPDLNAMIRAAGLDPLSGPNPPESES